MGGEWDGLTHCHLLQQIAREAGTMWLYGHTG